MDFKTFKAGCADRAPGDVCANKDNYKAVCLLTWCPSFAEDEVKVIEVDLHCDNILIEDVNADKLGDCLNEALKVITGDRQDTYCKPEDSFGLIAEYWDVYIKRFLQGNEVLRAKDVAHMMMLLKIARCSGQKPCRDNYVDIAGYASITADKLLEK